jgi:iron complex outermembrane receptor protein
MSMPFRARARRSRLRASVLLALCIPSAVCASDDAPDDLAPPTTLDRVEVRGSSVPDTVESIDEARARLDDRAGGTGVVDAKQYRDGRVSTLADALGHATGVFIQPRFGAEEARMSIRGSGIQRTFHGRGLELLQDGSPLNLADGSFDFQAVEPLSARYIEVYRGANALEYGAATLGGAVNFISPTGYDMPAATVRIEGGSYGYGRGHAALAGNNGTGDGYLGVSAFGQDGFRDHARQETYRLFGNAGHRFGDTLDGRVYLTHVDTGSELPGNLTLAQAMDRPEAANPGNLSGDQRRDFTLTRIGTRLAWTPPGGGSLLLSAYVADKSLHHPIFQVLDQDSRDHGLDLRWRSEGELAGRRNVLVAGVTLAQGTVDDDRFANVGGHEGERTNQLDLRARNTKLYVENQTWLDERWAVSLGAQGLKSTRRSRDLFVAAGSVDESFDVEFRGVSPKLGLMFQIDAASRLYANLSGSLEPPSFSEITGGATATLVDKQSASTAEIGYRTRREDLTLDLSVYRARVEDELLALTDGNGNPLGTVNARRTLHQGIEFGLGWQFSPALAWSMNYLLNDFRFDGDAVYGDNHLAGIPRQHVRSAVRWQVNERLFVAPNVEWVPQGYHVDHANSFSAPGYHLLGLKIGGDLGARCTWFVDARNLQDRQWIASTNVVADARGLDATNFLPGDGRSVYLGVEWRMP